MKKMLLLLSMILMINATTTFAQEKVEGKKEAEKAELIKVGDKCENFEFFDVDDKKVNLYDFKGKYILIDIWATWCGPCTKEIPHLKALEERMHGKNIHFVSVSVDKDKEAWKNKVKTENMTGAQLHNGGNRALSKAFGANFIPHFILLDKKGKVVKVKMDLRPSSGDEIYNYLMSLKGM